jgi:hypothetical protein
MNIGMKNTLFAISFGCVSGLLACAKQPVVSPKAMPSFENVWSFSVDLHVETKSAGLSLDAAGQLRDLGTFDQYLEGTVFEGPFRLNRDGTESWRLRFGKVTDRNGTTFPLESHAVETRRFAGGPLLSLQQARYAAAVGQFDALDSFVALLFLLPPKKGDAMRGQIAWPLRLGPGQKSHHFSSLEWKRVESENESGVSFHYEGNLTARAQDRDWQGRALGDGRIRGELDLGDDGSVLTHRFWVERTTSWSFPEEDSELVQYQTLHGEFGSQQGQIVEPWADEFYLTEKQVLEGIHNRVSEWEACSPVPDWSVSLNFQIRQDGSVSPIEELGACAEVLSDVYFPHHHPDFQVQTQLVLRAGKYIPYPTAVIPLPVTTPAHLVFQLGTEPSLVRELLSSKD